MLKDWVLYYFVKFASFSLNTHQKTKCFIYLFLLTIFRFHLLGIFYKDSSLLSTGSRSPKQLYTLLLHSGFLRCFQKMAKITPLFSLKNLLVVSLALNVSLIWRAMHESEKCNFDSSFSLQQQRRSVMAGCVLKEKEHVSERTHLSLSSSPSPSPSSSLTSTDIQSQDGGERIINVDQ